MTSHGFFKKKARRPECFFNMVEIAIALAVVAIGVVSIVALFPVGLEATRDAIADSYAADAADSFLHYKTGQLKTSWVLTNIKSDQSLVPTTTPSGAGVTMPGTSTTIIDGSNGTFLIQQGADFSGVFRMWWSPVFYSYYNGTQWTSDDLLPGKAIGLNLEVSWPAQAPYDKRRRALYYLEVFNPNN